METDNKKVSAGGDVGGDKYWSIAKREVVKVVLVRWPEEGWRLTGDEPKWRQGWKMF